MEAKKGGISVILRGYLCYFRGVSLLFPFLRALCFKARRAVLRLNTINTVKWYTPPIEQAAIPSYNRPVGKSPTRPELIACGWSWSRRAGSLS